MRGVTSAVRLGIGLAPEERKAQALLLEVSVTRNITLSGLGRYARLGWLDRGRERADVPALVAAVVAFSRMAGALGDVLVEAEINPLFVRPAGQGVCAADGVAVLQNRPN